MESFARISCLTIDLAVLYFTIIEYWPTQEHENGRFQPINMIGMEEFEWDSSQDRFRPSFDKGTAQLRHLTMFVTLRPV